jgi:hypothetical protein
VPNRYEVFVAAVLALGILGLILAMSVTPPPWSYW